MPLVLTVALLSACVALALAGYAWHAYKAKRKIAKPKPTILRQVVGQPTGKPERSSQNEVLELASVGSTSTTSNAAPEGHRIHIATFTPIESSVETAFVACPPESLPKLAETETNLIAVEERNGADLTVKEEPKKAAKMQDQPVAESPTPQDEEECDSETASVPNEISKHSLKKAQTGPPNTRRINPEKRGGRFRGRAEGQTQRQTRKSLLRTPRPEIVCWKRDREWILAVEIPEVVTTQSVLQNGMPIREDELEKGCWLLAEHRGIVTFSGEDERTEHFGIEVGDESCLVFKLSGLERDRGRRVKNPTKGSFLVIAPTDWERDESESGPAPARPEYVCLEAYRAHFFNIEFGSGQRIAFRDSTGRSHVIGSNEICFQLVGKELSDASEVAGPLFGYLPPRIRINNGIWESVETIVLGEEGRGSGRWRSSFQPDPTLSEQDIATEIADRGTGWYFVRFYDSQDDLIDSLDFRFCPGLKCIAIPQSDPLPSPEGHREVVVEFQHDSHCRVHPNALSSAQVECSEGRTILKIPPEEKVDRTHWFVSDGGTHVTVTILVERVWWGSGKVNEPPTQWSDSCLFPPRDSFAATSEDAVWIRLPKPRWIDRIFVGFQQNKWRQYMPKVEENTVVIALRDFSDSQEVADRSEDHVLKFWAKVNGSLRDVAVATVAAQPVEENLNVNRLRACQLARVLTVVGRATDGPLRQLVKEVRRKYKRSAHSEAETNIEFVREALCTISVFVQLTRQEPPPRCVRRWRLRVRGAGRQFPEAMRQVWRRYRELQGRRVVESKTPSILAA